MKTKNEDQEGVLQIGGKYNFDSVFGLKRVVVLAKWPVKFGQMKALFYMYGSKKPWILANYVIKANQMIDLYNISQVSEFERILSFWPKGYASYLPPGIVNKGIDIVLEEDYKGQPVSIPEDPEERLGWLKENCSPTSLFKGLLEEEGIFGYETTILNWVQTIWGLNLQ